LASDQLDCVDIIAGLSSWQYPIDALLNTNVPDRDAQQVPRENLLLRSENERLCRESSDRFLGIDIQ